MTCFRYVFLFRALRYPWNGNNRGRWRRSICLFILIVTLLLKEGRHRHRHLVEEWVFGPRGLKLLGWDVNRGIESHRSFLLLSRGMGFKDHWFVSNIYVNLVKKWDYEERRKRGGKGTKKVNIAKRNGKEEKHKNGPRAARKATKSVKRIGVLYDILFKDATMTRQKTQEFFSCEVRVLGNNSGFPFCSSKSSEQENFKWHLSRYGGCRNIFDIILWKHEW